MKVPAGFLYLTVSAYGMYWAHHMITRRFTSSGVRYWYLDLLLGAVILGIGGILRWTRWQEQTRRLPLMVSAMVASTNVGATVETLHRHLGGKMRASVPEMGTALLPVLLVLLLLCIALFEKFRPELIEPPAHSLDRA